MDKDEVIAALLAQVQGELHALERISEMARDEATSSESRAENQYDTRATEASYLAAGQGQRVLAVRRFAAMLDATAATSFDLFELEGDAGTAWFLLAPDGGGRRVRVGGQDVVVVTRESPVGAELSRSREGDTVRIGPQGAAREYEIVAID